MITNITDLNYPELVCTRCLDVDSGVGLFSGLDPLPLQLRPRYDIENGQK